MGIKRSHSVDDTSNRCFEYSKMQLFESMCESFVVVKSNPSSAVGFPDFLENISETDGCVPLTIDCSALF